MLFRSIIKTNQLLLEILTICFMVIYYNIHIGTYAFFSILIQSSKIMAI